jgi:hypothetical protein
MNPVAKRYVDAMASLQQFAPPQVQDQIQIMHRVMVMLRVQGANTGCATVGLANYYGCLAVGLQLVDMRVFSCRLSDQGVAPQRTVGALSAATGHCRLSDAGIAAVTAQRARPVGHQKLFARAVMKPSE